MPKRYDAISDRAGQAVDGSGHGSQVASVACSIDESDGHYNSTAPDANLVAVKAFDTNGQGRYADVIRGIDWVVNHKDAYDIRVLNLSFSTLPQSHEGFDIAGHVSFHPKAQCPGPGRRALCLLGRSQHTRPAQAPEPLRFFGDRLVASEDVAYRITGAFVKV